MLFDPNSDSQLMNLLTENKSKIMETFMRILDHISDKDYQMRIWIKGEGPEVDDFDETCCIFFGDGNPVLENHKDYGITENQYQTLKRFRDEFAAFCRGPALIYYLPQEFIDTPEWTRITILAKEVLISFDYSKK